MIGVVVEHIVCSDSDIKNQGYAMISVSGDVVVGGHVDVGENDDGFGGFGCLKFSPAM